VAHEKVAHPRTKSAIHPDVTATPEIELRILEDELARTEEAIRRKREEMTPKFTLDEVFEYDPGDVEGDAMTGVLAVSYLLDSLSSVGNDPIDGVIAQGLAQVLKHYAGDICKYLKPAAPDLEISR
jgi:hypothetical protein